jgi:hypothetical protein
MKIKKLMVLAAVAVVFTATGTRADDWMKTHMYYDTQHQQAFNANEFSLDLFGTYQAPERHFLAFPNTSIQHGGHWGGGVGGNYFLTPMLGLGADTAFLSGTKHFADHVGGNLILRIPIEAVRLAPYVFGGGGRAFNPTWSWYADVGAGLEIRLNPKLGIFGDARYIWMEHDTGATDQAALRAGVRLVF